MNRRNFGNLFAAGVLPPTLVGCHGNAPEAGTSSKGRKTVFKSLPVSGALVHDWLPERDFGNPDFVPLASPPIPPEAVEGEGAREATVRFRKWQRSEFTKIRSLQQHLELSLLEPRERKLMQSISEQIGHQPESLCGLRYSAMPAGTFERVRSLDLLGVRNSQANGAFAYAEDSDPEIEPLKEIPDRVFGDLAAFSAFQRLFFNYAKCAEGLILKLLRQRARTKLQCLGVPSNLSLDEFEAILESVEIDVVDLSGRELDWETLVEMIRLTFGKGVRWIILTGYMSYPWIHLQERLKEVECPKGCIIGYDCVLAVL